MSFKFPDKILLKFINAISKSAIPKLLVLVVLKAKEKNDYSLMPMITDKNGQLEISKQEAITAISNLQTESPMDYAGSIEDILAIKIIVENENSLQERQQRMAKYYPENASQLRNQIETANNSSIRNLEIIINLTEAPTVIEVNIC